MGAKQTRPACHRRFGERGPGGPRSLPPLRREDNPERGARAASWRQCANLAVAAARAGGVATTFVGALGDDESGELLGACLGGAGVDVGVVGRVDAGTGAALISGTPDDENTSIVAPGANGQLRIGAAQAERLAAADVVLASWMYRPTSSSKPPPART